MWQPFSLHTRSKGRQKSGVTANLKGISLEMQKEYETLKSSVKHLEIRFVQSAT